MSMERRDFGGRCSEERRRGVLAALSLVEVAERVGCTPQSVLRSERAALAKLRRHPVMVELSREYFGEDS